MKKHIIALALGGLIVAGGSGYYFLGSDEPPAPTFRFEWKTKVSPQKTAIDRNHPVETKSLYDQSTFPLGTNVLVGNKVVRATYVGRQTDTSSPNKKEKTTPRKVDVYHLTFSNYDFKSYRLEAKDVSIEQQIGEASVPTTGATLSTYYKRIAKSYQYVDVEPNERNEGFIFLPAKSNAHLRVFVENTPIDFESP